MKNSELLEIIDGISVRLTNSGLIPACYALASGRNMRDASTFGVCGFLNGEFILDEDLMIRLNSGDIAAGGTRDIEVYRGDDLLLRAGRNSLGNNREHNPVVDGLVVSFYRPGEWEDEILCCFAERNGVGVPKKVADDFELSEDYVNYVAGNLGFSPI